jgi:D-cysteine desulfhydrase
VLTDRLRIPTPLEPLPRAGAALGVELWVKREDQLDAVFSGNKARKLLPLLEAAAAAGADTLVGVGQRSQTNLGRVVAWAAAVLGWRAKLLLGCADPKNPPPARGNLLLATALGAEVAWYPEAEILERSEALLAEALAALRSAGARPHAISLSATSPTSIAAYRQVAAEIELQLPPGPKPVIVCPVATGGTMAGLVQGAGPERVLGVLVTHSEEAPAARAAIAELSGVSPDRLWLIDGSGPGLGRTGPEDRAALLSLAQAEGLLLDPVYCAKAYAVLEREARARSLGERAVLMMTGGALGLLAAS